MLIRALVIACILLVSVIPSWGAQNPFGVFTGDAANYFAPVAGEVTAVRGELITSGISNSTGLIPGMRLDIIRKGAPFIHPITKEAMGLTEEIVGKAQVLAVTSTGSDLKVIRGNAKAGDSLRISSTKVRVLYYQKKDVDWKLSEKYFNMLKENGRFDAIDAIPGVGDDAAVLSEARRTGAEVVAVLSQALATDGVIIRQRFLWVDDGQELFSSELKVAPELAGKSVFGEDLFTPKKIDVTLTFDLDYNCYRITSGDFDGNGLRELAISAETDVRFYTAGAVLNVAFEKARIQLAPFDRIVWLDAMDINGDGRDELVVSMLIGSKGFARVYGLKDGEWRELWRADYLVRLMDGVLKGQRYSIDTGYLGEIVDVDAQRGVAIGGGVKLPKGLNLYTFTYLNTDEGRKLAGLDSGGYLRLYGADGHAQWKSEESFAERVLVVDDDAAQAPFVMTPRIVGRGGYIELVRNIPITPVVSGIGTKGSRFLRLFPKGEGLEERAVIVDMPGKNIDYTVSGDLLYVLHDSYGVDSVKFLLGRGMFISKLSVYSLGGR